jgi:hypothetical protein
MTTDIAALKQRIDLADLIGRDTPLVRIAGTRGGEWAGPCPFCGGQDRLHVQPAYQGGRWFCRQCAPRGGDAIDYLRRRDRLTFHEALSRLAVLTPAAQPAYQTTYRGRPQTLAWREPRWQQAAQAEARQAAWALAHDPDAEAGRAYLLGRGLIPDAWQAWGLGYALAWHPRRKAKLPAITLPWQADAALQAVQYRFILPELAQPERFSQRKGGERLLYGLDLCMGRDTLVLVEGELNAVSLWQVLHGRVDVLSCGSQEGLANRRTLRLLESIVEAYRRVFIWLDDLTRAAAAVPAIAPATGYALWSEGGRDANDRLRDGSLAAWLAAHGV